MLPASNNSQETAQLSELKANQPPTQKGNLLLHAPSHARKAAILASQKITDLEISNETMETEPIKSQIFRSRSRSKGKPKS